MCRSGPLPPVVWALKVSLGVSGVPPPTLQGGPSEASLCPCLLDVGGMPGLFSRSGRALCHVFTTSL